MAGLSSQSMRALGYRVPLGRAGTVWITVHPDHGRHPISKIRWNDCFCSGWNKARLPGGASGQGRAAERNDPFHPGGGPMSQISQPEYRAGVRHPVELNDAPRSDERLVAVVRIVAAAERHQSPFDRRYFDENVLNISGRAQQAETAAGLFPARIHVEQHRDDLGDGVGVDVAVASTTAAGGNHHLAARGS